LTARLPHDMMTVRSLDATTMIASLAIKVF
jgi:hypothetical protein